MSGRLCDCIRRHISFFFRFDDKLQGYFLIFIFIEAADDFLGDIEGVIFSFEGVLGGSEIAFRFVAYFDFGFIGPGDLALILRFNGQLDASHYYFMVFHWFAAVVLVGFDTEFYSDIFG